MKNATDKKTAAPHLRPAPTEADYNKSLEENKRVSDTLHLLTFYLDNTLYGIDIDTVEEVIKPRHITELPRMADYVRGIISIRGDMLLTVDPKRRLKLASSETPFERIVVVLAEGLRAGLTVDRLAAIVEITEPLRPVTESKTASKELLEGNARAGTKDIIVLNLKALLDTDCMQGTQ